MVVAPLGDALTVLSRQKVIKICQAKLKTPRQSCLQEGFCMRGGEEIISSHFISSLLSIHFTSFHLSSSEGLA